MASAFSTATKVDILTEYLSGRTLKVMLLDTSYTPDPDHSFASSLTSAEIDVTGYTRGFGNSARKTLASVSITADNTNNVAVLDAADLTWGSAGGTTDDDVAYVAIIEEVTSDADSPIWCVLDNADVTTNGFDLTVAWPANGILRW